MCTMEQLAHFVTKSFEYNNNRVLDVINMSTKSLCENYLKISDSDILSNGCETDVEEDDTLDIDITDQSSIDDSNDNTFKKSECDSDNNNSNSKDMPLSLVKKSIKDIKKHTTKNWLISDSPKKNFEGNNR